MLNNLIAALNDCVWAFDVNAQKYVFISPSILTVTGYHVKDFQQNTGLWEEIIDPRDYDGVITAGNKSDTEEWVELTYRIISKGGKTKWIHQKKRHFTDEQTNHQILLSVIEDVSDQKPINFNLQESLGDFSILFNNNPTPMWIYELPTLRIMKVNNAALMHYGYSENEFLSMTIRDIRPRFDLAKFNDYLYRKAIPESSLHGFNSAGVWKHQNKKGEIVYAEITGHEIKYNNHSCRIIIAADVTEKVLQQEDLKRREQFLTSLIDSQTNFLVRIDANCLFTFANKWFFKTLGYKKTDIIGKHFSVTALPEEKELCEQAFKNCSKNPGKVISLKHRKLDIEGNIHWIKWEFIAIAGENGQVTELQGIGQDVTQNVEIEKEIVWTKNNLEALINNTEDLTWSIDREGRYVYMNSAYRKRITDTVGVIPKEGDDAYAHSGQTDHINDEWRSYYHRAFLGERYFTRHESPDPKTKEPSYFEVSFNPIYKATKDEIIGVGCFARNITDRLKTEEALIEQNERLKNIASLSSHELRRPVASMMGLLNILDRSNFSNPENEQIMDHLFTVTNEIDEVIRLIVNKTFIDTRFPL
jgi:PAS domain S-box-containing protein